MNTYQVTLDSVIAREGKIRSIKVLFITGFLNKVIEEALRQSNEMTIEEGQQVIVRDIRKI